MNFKHKILIVAVAGTALNLGFYAEQKTGLGFEPPPAQQHKPKPNAIPTRSSPLILIYDPELKFVVETKELQGWTESYIRLYSGTRENRLNQNRIREYLAAKIANHISRPAASARFAVKDGIFSELMSAQKGLELDIPATLANITAALTQGNPTAPLATVATEPTITLDTIGQFGIKALLATGSSDFTGSPKSRAHNINTGARTYNGILVKPGDEFSFNNLLGPVDASTGYLPEMVIKGGKLIPEYGGGLCQVSTTLFRAAAAAGLPITERHAHSLPVRYYNPQGFDATIYPGIVDLKFINDTPGYILIQSMIDDSKLYFEIYGTADNRKVAMDGPVQYDISATGSLKAVLKRTTTYADGTEKKDEFYSAYKSPAIFSAARNPLE